MAKAKIAVIGAGRMGHSIAFRFAWAGHPVAVFDAVPQMRQSLPDRVRAAAALVEADARCLESIAAHESLEAAVAGADWVIEAVPEILPLKQELFAELDRLTPPTVILTSNTSTIPIHDISLHVLNKQRVVGTHFWNPAHVLKLVEVVQMEEENLPAVEKTLALLREAGWRPFHVKRDIPGFIGNRLQHALKQEAIALVAAGVCDGETVDEIVRLGFGARLGAIGPLEQSDLGGLESTLSIHKVLMHDLDCTREPHPLLVDLVRRGELGVKTLKGFRTWTPEKVRELEERRNAFLAEEARRAAAQYRK